MLPFGRGANSLIPVLSLDPTELFNLVKPSTVDSLGFSWSIFLISSRIALNCLRRFFLLTRFSNGSYLFCFIFEATLSNLFLTSNLYNLLPRGIFLTGKLELISCLALFLNLLGILFTL